MYNGLMAAVGVVTIYFMARAVIGHFSPGMRIFSLRSTLCVVLGSLLGIFVSTPLWGISHEAGYIGIGGSIGLMYVLFYSGIINTVINRIPQNIRRGFRIAFNVIRVVLIVAVIICAVVGVLKYIGV